MTDQHRTIQGVKAPGVRQQSDVVLPGFAETDARVNSDAGRFNAGGQKCIAPRKNSKTSEYTTSSYCGLSCMVRGSPCMCITHRPQPLDTASSIILGFANAVTSFIASAPAIRASSATSGSYVSMETGTGEFRHRAPTTGITRSISSRTDTRCAPGACSGRRGR